MSLLNPPPLNSSAPPPPFQDIQEWSRLHIFLALISGAITFLTISGNILILYLFIKSKRCLRSPTHWLIANLAVADFHVGAMVMPLLIYFTFNDFKWPWGDAFCDLVEYFHFTLCATSILSMTSISVERYLGVRFPLRHKRILTKKRVWKLMGLTWLLGILLTGIPLTIWPIRGLRIPGRCSVNLRSDFVLCLSLTVFFLPVSITCVMYWHTYREALKLYIPQQGIVQNLSIGTSMNSYTASHVSRKGGKGQRSDEERYLDTKHKQTSLAKKLTLVVVIMLIMYAPLFTVFLIAGIDATLVSSNLILAVGWLRYSSSTVNPFLYIFVIPGFKKAFFKTVWNEKSSLEESSSPDRKKHRKQTSSSYSSSGLSGGGSYSGYPSTSETVTNNEPSDYRRQWTDDEGSCDSSTDSFKDQPACVKCGIEITDDTKGDEALQICVICNIRYNSKLVSFTDVKHLKIVSRPSVEEKPEPGKQGNSSAASSGSLVQELRAFLKEMEDKRGSLSGGETAEVKDRTSQLLSNIVKILPPDEHLDEDRYCKINQLRRSIATPISYRKSGMKGETSVEDSDELKQLDDILEKIEKEIGAFDQIA